MKKSCLALSLLLMNGFVWTMDKNDSPDAITAMSELDGVKFAAENGSDGLSSKQLDARPWMEQPVAAVSVCPCPPVEHVYYKYCVMLYNDKYNQNVPVEFSTEGLPTKVVAQLRNLAIQTNFRDENGRLVTPALNPKGDRILPLFMLADFNAKKSQARNIENDYKAQFLAQKQKESLAKARK